MSVLFILLLFVLILGGLPGWGYHGYGYGPSGVGGILLVVLVVLLLTGRLRIQRRAPAVRGLIPESVVRRVDAGAETLAPPAKGKTA